MSRSFRTSERAIEEYRPDVVVDLSDEPVLGPRERLRAASTVLALGLPYEGPGFRFDPPVFAPVPVPTIAVIGTGKRVGKTAVTGRLARTLSARHRIVVVAMGRGGPAEPEEILAPPGLDTLLALSRSRTARCVRSPRDRGSGRCADGRLPPLRRWPGG